MPRTTNPSTNPSPLQSPIAPVCLFCVLVLASVGIISRASLLTVIVDGLSAGLIVVPASLGGLWLVAAMRLEPLPWRWRLMLGAGLGLGATSVAVLIGGLMGWMGRTEWIVYLSLSAAAGVVRLRQLLVAEESNGRDQPPATAGRWRWLWIVAAPFAVLALLSASNAPGFLWAEEGFGYDVLEYHLQLPREYLAAGRIAYLPHNVYANFPSGVEMLYLLAMIVHGDPRECGTIAQMIHLAFGALFVGAAWAAGRDRSPRAGVVCGVTAASTGWLEYLAALAYVENAMLFFGLCSAAVLLRIRGGKGTSDADATPAASAGGTIRRGVAAGVLAGFACGCKYTAAPMIALPLGLAAVIVGRNVQEAFRSAFGFGLATVVAFSPWLLKNLAMTGNPVFPLANGWFRASPPGWGEEQTRTWERGHSLPHEERTIVARTTALWTRIAGDAEQRFGPALLGLGLFGLIGRRRDRTDAALVVVIVLQALVWMFATHLYARFAVPLMIPLTLLAGRAIVGGAARPRAVAVLIAVVVGAAWSVGFAAMRQARESPGGAPASLFVDGLVPGFEFLGTINDALPADAKVLLVGEARPFYIRRPTTYGVAFNENPFLKMIADGMDGAAMVDRLRADGVTHLLVNWSEVRRLSRTYGFSPPITVEQLESGIRRLESAGLRLLKSFDHPDPGARDRYVELFTVP